MDSAMLKKILHRNVVCLALAASVFVFSFSLCRPAQGFEYIPFSSEAVARPSSVPSLQISKNYPRLDGATSALPAYAAFAQAVYVGLDAKTAGEFVRCSRTEAAFQHLIEGNADIFFGLAPSATQRDSAAARGLTLTETPIGWDAFIFFVNQANPVRSLTLEQVRAIYSGRIVNWKELGGLDEPIAALQRTDDSGSQTTMVETVMKGLTMVEAPPDFRMIRMADSVYAVAFDSGHNALTYSFSSYLRLFFNPNHTVTRSVRVIAIDNVEPTPENIRNGTYPFTVPILAITARPPSRETQSLLDWIVSPEGQYLLEDSGHVPAFAVRCGSKQLLPPCANTPVPQPAD